MHKSHRQVDILSSEGAISISFIQPRAPIRLKFQFLCDPLSGQLTFISRICRYFSAFCFKVEDLRISSTRLSIREKHCCSWKMIIGSFTSVKWFHVARDFLTEIVDILQMLNECSGAFRVFSQPGPLALHKLYIQQPGLCHAPLSVAVVLFMIKRWRSGRPIAVEYE